LAEGKKINAQQHRQVEIIEIEVRNAQQVVETARKCVELGTLGFKSCLTASAENAGVVQGRIVALVKQLRVLCACGQAASSIKQLLSNNFYLTTRANY
jgi:hypothetical protein